MEQGKISVQTENIFPIIKKFLYSDHEIFLRELISNAVDATSKLQTLAAKGELKEELGDVTIDILVDPDQKTLTIRDRGIGMSEAEVKKYLNQVAFSSAEAFVKKYKEDANLIGHFGLGFYSSFMVAKRVDVHSRSYKKSPKAVSWSCTGNPEYTITTSDKKSRGTDVVLHLDSDSEEFLQKERLESLLKKYCKFLPIPIRFGTRTTTRFEGEGDNKEEIKEEVDNIINNTAPAWKKNPSKLKEDEYKAFYDELYPMSSPPLFWIHLNIDYPFNLTGILYFPKITNNLEVQKNKIQLYCNQVFVTDEVGQIVPEFLTLLHGVIDSPDIPLNVSRSYLQGDQNVKKITSYITKKVADKLSSLYKKEREKYEEKWPEIGTFIKYGMMSDEKFNERMNDYFLFKDVDGKFHTLEEYKALVSATQIDKYDKTVLIYTNSPQTHDSYIQAAKNRQYDVLEMDNVIDNHFMQHLEYKTNDITFVRVDSDTIDNLIQKDEEKESVLSEKDQEKVKSLFDAAVPEGTFVNLKPMLPEDHPVMITKPEFLRRMKEMQALQGMGGMNMDDAYHVVVNTNHPLISEKLLRMRSADKKKDFAEYLYNLALLNQQMLTGSELTSFINKSIGFLSQ